MWPSGDSNLDLLSVNAHVLSTNNTPVILANRLMMKNRQGVGKELFSEGVVSFSYFLGILKVRSSGMLVNVYHSNSQIGVEISGEPWFAFANSCGINTPIRTDFKIPT